MTKIKQRKWLITIISYLVLWTIFITTLIFGTRPSRSRLVTPFTQDEITDKETLTTQFLELTSIYQEGNQPVNQEMVIDHLGPPHETNQRRSTEGEH